MSAAPEHFLSNTVVQLPNVLAGHRAEASNSLWLTMQPAAVGGRQNFSVGLIEELTLLQERIIDAGCRWTCQGRQQPVDYVVLRSAHPQYFSLGGDLAHFRACIERRDGAALRDYAVRCVDLVHRWSTRFGGAAPTIALVQGRALGGGFETALACDYLIAEEQAEFGFPEIVFGLFPCTGGMSLLARRIGVWAAERMMTDSRVFSAAELAERGIVDEVVARGEGAAAVERFMRVHAEKRAARMALLRARNRMTALDYGELRAVVDDWVEAALALSPENLRIMDMLIRLQGATRT